MKRIAFGTVFGLIMGCGFIIAAMWESSEGQFSMFVNYPSLFIIMGGTLASMVIGFPMDTLKTLPSVIGVAFLNRVKKNQAISDIETIVGYANMVRREGILALENELDHLNDDPFLQKGIGFLVDGVGEETFELLLQTEMAQSKKRHTDGCAMIGYIAATAPSLGLVGTYAGLIPMLNSLDDPSALGPLMALELVSSFYGAFMAYIIFAPLAKRLQAIGSAESSRNVLLTEGLLNIRDGYNPRLIQENLTAFVSKAELDRAQKRGRTVGSGTSVGAEAGAGAR